MTDAIEKAFKLLEPTWPTYFSHSTQDARKQWGLLDDAERHAAAEKAEAYCKAVKCEGKSVCSLAVYLREKRWEKLPKDAQQAQPERIEMKPYGKAWVAYRMWVMDTFKAKEACAGPFSLPTPNGMHFIRGDDRDKFRWPHVSWVDAEAEAGRSVILPDGHGPLSFSDFDKVKVGSSDWDAWVRWHEVRDLPMFYPPSWVEYVWMPQRNPQGFELKHHRPVVVEEGDHHAFG